MLKLNLNPTFKGEVLVTIPGVEAPQKTAMIFKYRDKKAFTEWLESLTEQKDEDGNVTREAKTFVEAFLEFVVGWPGVDAEFTEENIKSFLDIYPSAYVEIFSQYSKLLFGSRIKN